MSSPKRNATRKELSTPTTRTSTKTKTKTKTKTSTILQRKFIQTNLLKFVDTYPTNDEVEYGLLTEIEENKFIPYIIKYCNKGDCDTNLEKTLQLTELMDLLDMAEEGSAGGPDVHWLLPMLRLCCNQLLALLHRCPADELDAFDDLDEG